MDALAAALSEFHFLRPLWLLALIPALALFALLWRQSRNAGRWQRLIQPELLEHLLEPGDRRRSRPLLWALLAGWMLATLALAGPAWEKRPMPAHQSQEALVILLDLSPSMRAEDIEPSRLVRARLKILDVLRQRRDGQTALVAYARSAHVVAPLTDDTATIESLVKVLSPELMPARGSRPEAAVDRALALMDAAGTERGRLLLITDGIVDAAVEPILQRLGDQPVSLSVLGVGTPDGAPIPNNRGDFERDTQGEVVVAKLREDRLKRLAGRSGGRYQRLRGDGADLEWLLAETGPGEAGQKQLEREFDIWYDRGHWLVLCVLPLIVYSFRRGLLSLALALPLLGTLPQPAQAQDWLAPWLTPDQRGAHELENDDPEAAAQHFDNPQWRGTALYRAEDYKAAAEAFARGDSARAHYNRGNALARAGDLEGALEAYDQALERDPELADAEANRELVERLKQQQKQQEKQQEQDQQQDSQGEQDPSREDEQSQQNGSSGDQSGETPPDNRSQSQPSSGQSRQEGDPPEERPEEPEAAAGDNSETPADESEKTVPGGEDEQDKPEESQAAQGVREGELDEEQRQATEQWLRRVPDDPGGLLRRKFEYQARQERIEQMRGESEARGPEQRW